MHSLTVGTFPDHFFEHELRYFAFVVESYENLLRTLDSLNNVEFKKEMSEGIVARPPRQQGRFTKARQSCDVTHSSAKRYDALIRLRFSFHLRYAFRPTIQARNRYFIKYNEKKLNVFKLVISYVIVSM